MVVKVAYMMELAVGVEHILVAVEEVVQHILAVEVEVVEHILAAVEEVVEHILEVEVTAVENIFVGEEQVEVAYKLVKYHLEVKVP